MTNEVQKMEATPPAVSETTALISVIERAASNPNVDIEKMERLLAMQERIIDRNAKQEFSEAMNQVQTAIPPVIADSKNDQTKSMYASYEALDAVVRPIYTGHGFSPTFGTGESPKENSVRVTCDLLHSGGHERHYFFDMPADGKGAKGGDVMTKTHAAGSAMSYGKRYLLIAMFNIPIKDKDDDGNGASGDGPINEKVLAEIRAELDAVGADIPGFCRYMGITALTEIRRSQVGKARNAIAAKKGKAK